MMGNSWLAISQINVAARCPHPALKAIAPWEAMTDMYGQAAARGVLTGGRRQRAGVACGEGASWVRGSREKGVDAERGSRRG